MTQRSNTVPPAALGVTAAEVLRRLHAQGAEHPDAPALLHKRGGHWRVFRWHEVAAEVERLDAALERRGVGAGARIALSGPFEPDLITFALAAHARGVLLHPVAPSLQGDGLAGVLAAIAPTHAFVQGRRTIARWLTVRPGGGTAAVPLFTSLPLGPPHPGPWRIDPLWPDEADDHGRRHWIGRVQALGRRDILWADEGTEWAGGLGAVIAPWLAGGTVVAFPEAAGSAARDRREIRPTALLASPERHRAIAEEILRRLPPPGSLGRRVHDALTANPAGVAARLVTARLNALLGLPRSLEPAARTPGAVPEGAAP